MRYLSSAILLFLISLLPVHSVAQEALPVFGVPFDFPLLLSGNFGELRSNHFHAGVDFKTQGVVGKPISCVADGYISRVTVQPGGYGQAVYVMHDNGYMTVYGHLDRFTDAVAARVRACQYENEKFNVDLRFSPEEFRVERGELLAYAGNTGYSFGPHLHFEVRDSAGEELFDPLLFYRNVLKDTKAPKALSLAVYPRKGKGVAFEGTGPVYMNIAGDAVGDTIDAWGELGFGVRSYDYMDDTHNKYGVYRIELMVDDVLLFSSRMDKYSFIENRLINAWVDYGKYMENGEWYQKMFVVENNPLRALSVTGNSGWLSVNEERLYNVEVRLGDVYGNVSVYNAVVRGRKQSLPSPKKSTHRLYWFMDNSIDYFGMRLEIPAGELFEDALLDVQLSGSNSLSGCYDLGGIDYPVWHGARLGLRVNGKPDVDVSKLYIKRLTKKGGYSVGGKYLNGWMYADVTVLGKYEVAADTLPPRICPLKRKKWSSGIIAFSMADGETSIKSFKGTLDGKFVLFKYSSKNSRLTLDMRAEGVVRGEHELKVVVEDACGNVAVYEDKIRY